MWDREQTSIKSIQRCYFNMICNKAYYIMLDIVFEHLEILVVTQTDYNKRLIRARIGVGKKINPSPVSYINFGTKQKTHLQSAIFFKTNPNPVLHYLFIILPFLYQVCASFHSRPLFIPP